MELVIRPYTRWGQPDGYAVFVRDGEDVYPYDLSVRNTLAEAREALFLIRNVVTAEELFVEATTCHHGLSRDLCYDIVNHYPREM